MSQQSEESLKRIVLLLALITLLIGILRLTGHLPSTAPSRVISVSITSSPTHQAPESVEFELRDTPAPASIEFAPAEEWAGMLLDRALPIITRPLRPDEGLAWWRGSEAGGELGIQANGITIGDRFVEVTTLRSIDIMVPAPSDPNRLDTLSTVRAEQGAVVLTVIGSQPPFSTAEWRLSSADPRLAFEALLNQASLRAIRLQAAYIESPGYVAQLVLVGISRQDPAPLPSGTLVPDTPTPTLTQPPTATSTPTRVPEPYMGQVVAGKIDPVIDAAPLFNPNAVFSFIQQHPWTGLLTWTETGAQIGGRPVAVQAATELNFYSLIADDPSGTAVRFLTVRYVEGVTRFPDDLIYFQGQRAEEVLFWLVRRAAERGGRLYVAYDDFGVKQAITVIGFLPFDTPQASPTSTAPDF